MNIEQHLNLVYVYCERYRGLRIYDDVVGAGMVGLVLAGRGYDASKGLAFSTYATWKIRQEIRDEIEGNTNKNVPQTMIARTIRLPRYVLREFPLQMSINNISEDETNNNNLFLVDDVNTDEEGGKN